MNYIGYLINFLIVLFIVSIFGYLLSVLKEKYDLINNKVNLQSKKITQKLLDELDLKIFKLGNLNLSIGDEIKIYLKNNNSIKGTVLGAKKEDNLLCILTLEDKILELKVSKIKKLRIISKYGRIL
ncbi:LSm family protein [Paramaledivibacter caminithermalis]|jgi:hypothetical protein|uniref:Uncharacterized protein n=1 Tax=Paramaledivibacter caminithermalis (strain DSM 15212 / CIP 107654 / DViRD3) TaxID=1121301 RepID=A0A1M6S3L7_PARC5|nr:hypothetical protein [Paramaledivibacter caminithermalis]SHK39270.1 hypothetical protein SAMN02745912_03166 [Paramaledivibacter caminithermalis DSM 15212]